MSMELNFFDTNPDVLTLKYTTLNFVLKQILPGIDY